MSRWLSVLAMVLLAGAPLRAAEQSAPALSVSPPFQEAAFGSGQAEKAVKVTVNNSSDQPQAIKVSTLDFGTLDETGGVAFLGSQATDLQRKYGLAKWLKLDRNELTLGPKSSATVTATIQNQADLAPGGHYAAVIFTLESQLPTGSEQPRVAVNQAFSSLIFAKKIGGERYGLSLQRPAAPPNWRLPAKLDFRFKNTGNVHATPRGVVRVLDPNGRTVAKGVINPQSSIILPETSRVYPVQLAATEPVLWPGLYRLQVQYRYDGRAEFTTESFTFYFHNLIGLGLLAALGLAALAAMVLLLRQRRQRCASKHKRID